MQRTDLPHHAQYEVHGHGAVRFRFEIYLSCIHFEIRMAIHQYVSEYNTRYVVCKRTGTTHMHHSVSCLLAMRRRDRDKMIDVRETRD
jgi:hypothetical protein